MYKNMLFCFVTVNLNLSLVKQVQEFIDMWCELQEKGILKPKLVYHAWSEWKDIIPQLLNVVGMLDLLFVVKYLVCVIFFPSFFRSSICFHYRERKKDYCGGNICLLLCVPKRSWKFFDCLNAYWYSMISYGGRF